MSELTTRWKGIKKDWTDTDVHRLRGSVNIEYTLAKLGCEKLWKLLNEENSHVAALGALTGNQAVQQVLDDGLRTKDILSKGKKEVSTSQMGDAIISKLK